MCPVFSTTEGWTPPKKSVVVDWYYKKPDEAGRTLLHYCKFCNGVVLYASENDPALAGRGFYDHGKYPFVFDPLFMEEDSPAGFGYIDVMKECQTAIDRMNHAMDENVLLASKQRYVLSDTAGVNEEELADLSRDIVHVAGRLGDESFRPLQTAGLQGNSLSYRNSRIEELKEISGNRDMTQGGTAGGVTAAIDFLYQVITVLRQQRSVTKLYVITFGFALFVPILLVNFTGLPGAVIGYLIVMCILLVLLIWEYMRIRMALSHEKTATAEMPRPMRPSEARAERARREQVRAKWGAHGAPPISDDALDLAGRHRALDEDDDPLLQ